MKGCVFLDKHPTTTLIYAYIRVSTDKQTTENQRFEILKFGDEKRLVIDRWVEETVSGTRRVEERKLGSLLAAISKDDILIVIELSRLGRSLMEVPSHPEELCEDEKTGTNRQPSPYLTLALNSFIIIFCNQKQLARHLANAVLRTYDLAAVSAHQRSCPFGAGGSTWAATVLDTS